MTSFASVRRKKRGSDRYNSEFNFFRKIIILTAFILLIFQVGLSSASEVISCEIIAMRGWIVVGTEKHAKCRLQQ